MSARRALLTMIAVASAFAVSACATTAVRAYSDQELGELTRYCRLAYGEVVQFPEQPRFIFLFPVRQPEQLRCVRQWTDRRRLHLVYMEGLTVEEVLPPDGSDPTPIQPNPAPNLH